MCAPMQGHLATCCCTKGKARFWIPKSPLVQRLGTAPLPVHALTSSPPIHAVTHPPVVHALPVHAAACIGGGGGAQGALNPIAENCEKLRTNCGEIAGKLRENCGAVTKPPEASRSNTSAQRTHRAPTSTRGGQAKSNCGKMRKVAENCEKLGEFANLNPPPPLHAFHLHAHSPSDNASAQNQLVTVHRKAQWWTTLGPSPLPQTTTAALVCSSPTLNVLEVMTARRRFVGRYVRASGSFLPARYWISVVCRAGKGGTKTMF